MDALASLHAKMLRLASKSPVPTPHRAAVLGIKQHLLQPSPPSPTFPANGAARRAGEGHRRYHPVGMLGRKAHRGLGPWARNSNCTATAQPLQNQLPFLTLLIAREFRLLSGHLVSCFNSNEGLLAQPPYQWQQPWDS